jgi:hypothetical protein
MISEAQFGNFSLNKPASTLTADFCGGFKMTILVLCSPPSVSTAPKLPS